MEEEEVVDLEMLAEIALEDESIADGEQDEKGFCGEVEGAEE